MERRGDVVTQGTTNQASYQSGADQDDLPEYQQKPLCAQTTSRATYAAQMLN